MVRRLDVRDMLSELALRRPSRLGPRAHLPSSL